MPHRFLALLVLVFLYGGAACADQPAAEDRALRLSLANAGAVPLHCRLMFGHWVEQDLGMILPGGAVELAVSQAARDGALYILRADGQRRMMIETIICGRDGDWMASYGQVDFAPARSSQPARIEASCALPEEGGRVSCAPVRLGK